MEAPVIYFENNKKSTAIVKENNTVIVRLRKVFNAETFDLFIETDLTYTKINDYKYEVTGDIVGMNLFHVYLSVKKSPKIKHKSNQILIYVI